MILAGDIGGTKCNLALYELRPGGYKKVVKHRYACRDFATFEEIIGQFLLETRNETKDAGEAAIDAAGFGVAGPVIGHRVKATNLPWAIDGAVLAKLLDTDHVVLLNDLEATAHSLALLQPSEISTLNRGVPAPQSTEALVAAGTGLGEAILFWDGAQRVVASSEGGHVDFAPRNEREIELLRHMKKRHEFVSVELILSGRGFLTIHEFLDASVRHPSFDDPETDAAPEITRLALAGQCPVCVQTLDMWVSMYGAEAGNMALKVLARGGVWIAGGIAVKIRKKMEDGTFFRAFCEKEKFGPLLAQIPVSMVLNEEAPLIGAMSQARRAVQLAASGMSPT
ncbi:MAG TPA: glucokinase [Candidatus Dormibacteraeota bacterium]|nr:glucokinase [Candidatus Dormibacteraeota bacterium]